jgi:preprotein translocase subunit SecA
MIYDVAENVVESSKNNGDYYELEETLLTVFAMDVPITEEEFNAGKVKEIAPKIVNAALETYKRKMDKLAAVANPIIRDVYKESGHRYENILIPVTDGKRNFNITAHLKTAFESQAKELVNAFEKQILLHIIDDEWKEHLRQLDELRSSVQNASYEQKDPLLIYKLESFGLFKEMIDSTNKKTLAVLMRGQIPLREPEQVREAKIEQKLDLSKYKTQKDDVNNDDPTKQDTREQNRPEPIRVEKKVGRNDQCPCGSGKKYKNCHGA